MIKLADLTPERLCMRQEVEGSGGLWGLVPWLIAHYGEPGWMERLAEEHPKWVFDLLDTCTEWDDLEEVEVPPEVLSKAARKAPEEALVDHVAKHLPQDVLRECAVLYPEEALCHCWRCLSKETMWECCLLDPGAAVRYVRSELPAEFLSEKALEHPSSGWHAVEYLPMDVRAKLAEKDPEGACREFEYLTPETALRCARKHPERFIKYWSEYNHG